MSKMADEQKAKRGRGRPPSATAHPPPTERVKKSLQDLEARGGRRVTVRLEKPAADAVDRQMAAAGVDQTTAINQLLSNSRTQSK